MDREALARYLSQRKELGEGDIVFSRLSGDEALALARTHPAPPAGETSAPRNGDYEVVRRQAHA
ncbi:MAG: hypothetical protein F4X13_01175, partial [Gammaproteobacteria bacterium]|nr:hypothetical protein [Gammaproteobacteria bacterium]